MLRHLVATVGDREVMLQVESLPGDRYRVIVDGREHVVDARAVRPGTWSLIIDGRSFTIDLDPRRSGTAVNAGVTDAVVRVEDARRRQLARASARGGTATRGEQVRAPIAGKVVKLAVAAGDTVAAGQSVVVLEAMKMENVLEAERGGTVEKIHVQPGQSVDTGELLVTLA
jgi:biotin carboxyl carrier protein